MENTIGLCLINIINSISGKYKEEDFICDCKICMYVRMYMDILQSLCI